MTSNSLPNTKRCFATSEKPNQKRMSREEREALIVKEAVCFFAEHGFEGKTRDLAARIGITQPLLYRYFPSKDHLIERVYDEVYVRRWDKKWEDLITNRALTLEERLVRFYTQYARAVYDYVWVRIFVYSGLKGVDINDRYLAIIRAKVLIPIATELRHAHDLPSPDSKPISDDEIELLWGLHGAFFYRAIRHFAYNMPLTDHLDQAIERDVRIFLAGAPCVQKEIVEGTT